MQRTLRAFTLIELLIVVAIIAILAAIAVPNFLEAQTRSKVSRTMTDMRSIATAMESYYVDHNAYAADWDWYPLTVPVPGPPGPVPPGALFTGDGFTYWLLTTPIAYITMPPHDVFLTDEYLQYYGPYFDYWGPRLREEELPPPAPSARAIEWRNLGLYWFIHTIGPDMESQLPGNWMGSVEWIYDPTNGTVSEGDIGRSNTRTYP